MKNKKYMKINFFLLMAFFFCFKNKNNDKKYFEKGILIFSSFLIVHEIYQNIQSDQKKSSTAMTIFKLGTSSLGIIYGITQL